MPRKAFDRGLALAFLSLATQASCGTSTGDVAMLDAASTPSDAPPSDAGPSDSSISCSVHAPTACPDPPTRYSDIVPILAERCIGCHSGVADGPWPLTAYEHVADWQDIIRSSMLDCSMPPPDADVPITLDERLTILNWIRCGLPP